MLRVSGKNFNIGAAMREHVSSRIEAAAQRYFGGGLNGHVIIDHEGSGYRADCTLHLSSGVSLHAEGRAQEAYASFDQAADRLERRLSRHKQRVRQNHASSAPSPQPREAAGDETMRDVILEAPAQEEPDDGVFNPIVIAERSRSLKEMPVSEAVLELDFTGAPVLVFRHAASGRVNILYRRADGNIGWLDPNVPPAS
jgi:ribosomal subunit interface protein